MGVGRLGPQEWEDKTAEGLLFYMGFEVTNYPYTLSPSHCLL